MMPYNRTLPVGALVHNRYRITRVLGAGGFGVTYQVQDLRENRVAAMKEFMPLDFACRKPNSAMVLPSGTNQGAFEKFREKFLKEAQMIYHFHGHPNIVEVRHLFYDNNTAYYVMELLDGMDLGKFVKQQGGKVSWDVLWPLMEQAVSALQTLHQANMIHCDISPENIYIPRNMRPKLLDFGAARALLRGETDASVIVLRNGYAPPEQRMGRHMGTWTDVYALAVTIYFCMTGIVPPNAEDRVIGEPVKWPSQLGIPIPSQQWETVLKKAMALRTEDRYQTIQSFWQELKNAAPQSRAQNPPSSTVVDPDAAKIGTPILECVQGRYAGQWLRVTGDMLLGVDNTKCAIAYPVGSPGVSRVHLRLWPDGNVIRIMDMRSTYGTWLNQTKLTPGLVYTLQPGMVLRFGQNQVFRLSEMR